MYDERHVDAESERFEMTEMMIMITITLIPLGTFVVLILFGNHILLETQIEGGRLLLKTEFLKGKRQGKC